MGGLQNALCRSSPRFGSPSGRRRKGLAYQRQKCLTEMRTFRDANDADNAYECQVRLEWIDLKQTYLDRWGHMVWDAPHGGRDFGPLAQEQMHYLTSEEITWNNQMMERERRHPRTEAATAPSSDAEAASDPPDLGFSVGSHDTSATA